MFKNNGRHWAHNLTNPTPALALIARYKTELKSQGVN